jgi:hypothetical protein
VSVKSISIEDPNNTKSTAAKFMFSCVLDAEKKTSWNYACTVIQASREIEVKYRDQGQVRTL